MVRANMLMPFDKEFNRLTLRINSSKAKFYQVTRGAKTSGARTLHHADRLNVSEEAKIPGKKAIS